MGLDYSYLLFFRKEALRCVLEKLGEMASSVDAVRTIIRFPDGDLVLPLTANQPGIAEFRYDAPEIHLAATFLFNQDGAISKYLGMSESLKKHSSLISDNRSEKAAIGLIYITVLQNPGSYFQCELPPGLIILNFKTPGSRMSILFQESLSIRREFIKFLERYQGLAGVLDFEKETLELFWLKGMILGEEIPGKLVMLDELKDLVKSVI